MSQNVSNHRDVNTRIQGIYHNNKYPVSVALVPFFLQELRRDFDGWGDTLCSTSYLGQPSEKWKIGKGKSFNLEMFDHKRAAVVWNMFLQGLLLRTMNDEHLDFASLSFFFMCGALNSFRHIQTYSDMEIWWILNRPNNFLRNSIKTPWNLLINPPSSCVHIHPQRSTKSWQFRHGWRGRLLAAKRRVHRTWLGHLEMSRGDGGVGEDGWMGDMGRWAPTLFFFPG